MAANNWMSNTFSTGDYITIAFGAIGMLAAFFALQGRAEINAENIIDNESAIVNVKEAVKESEERLRNELRAAESRQQVQIKSLDDKIDILLNRSK